MSQEKRKRKKLWLLLLILSILLLGVAIGVAVFLFWPEEKINFYKPDATTPTTEQASANTNELPSSEEVSTSSEPELAENPIDFDALQEVNSDIYAWINVPNTEIDYPIVQSPADKEENFYLRRNLSGNYEFRGTLYTQRLNAKDFSDPVTVIYGHDMLDGTMFGTLHYFRDKTFFAENELFYIYTPGHILTYKIVSAYKYDSRHILNSFDFSQEKVFQEYIDFMLSPQSMIAAVREDVTVTTDDRIVTLSTCIDYGLSRYLVQGVLIDDEPTA